MWYEKICDKYQWQSRRYFYYNYDFLAKFVIEINA